MSATRNVLICLNVCLVMPSWAGTSQRSQSMDHGDERDGRCGEGSGEAARVFVPPGDSLNAHCGRLTARIVFAV